MQQLVLTNIPMDPSNFIISILIHYCLPKVSLHALYMNIKWSVPLKKIENVETTRIEGVRIKG